MGRLRALALTGAVILGPAVPTTVHADGAPRSTWIVALRPEAGDSGVFAAVRAKSLGLTVLDLYHNAVSGFAATMPAAAVAALRADPLVKSMEPDQKISAFGQIIPTGVERVHADVSKTASIDGIEQPRVNVNVAVLDTGIDSSHPDLNVAGGFTCAKSRNYEDRYGHGTHAAGTIGALDNHIGVVGVAPGANMYGVKVLDDEGNGTTRELLCGIEWVTTTRTDSDPHNDIDVANLSLGGVGTDDGHCGETDDDILHQAVCASVAKGVTYVVAAGNDHEDASHLIPAAYHEVITVSALADSDGRPGGRGGSPSCRAEQDDTLADFSNYGPAVALIAAGNYDWNNSTDPDGIKEPLVDVSSF